NIYIYIERERDGKYLKLAVRSRKEVCICLSGRQQSHGALPAASSSSPPPAAASHRQVFLLAEAAGSTASGTSAAASRRQVFLLAEAAGSTASAASTAASRSLRPLPPCRSGRRILRLCSEAGVRRASL
ncbi:hypothetical protein OTU49_014507, partial [Cherax quadricarinatus]